MILAPFRVRSFRFQWPADLLTSWASEMETVILGWYVITQSGSVLLLTVFGSLQFFGTLAAPMFGVLSDRFGGRLLLCVMRSIYAALATVRAERIWQEVLRTQARIDRDLIDLDAEEIGRVLPAELVRTLEAALRARGRLPPATPASPPAGEGRG